MAELLVVIAIIAILATLLLPTLANAKANSKRVACMQNLKQLEAASQMYVTDSLGILVPNLDEQLPPPAGLASTNSWVYGNMKSLIDATNLPEIMSGLLYPYIPQTKSYRCPSDITEDAGADRDRSYAMNAWIGSDEMETLYSEQSYRVFLKESDLAASSPASTWVFIDEHPMTLADGWFLVTMNDSKPFSRLPASRHQNGYCLNFADGHVELHHLFTPQAQVPESQSQAFAIGGLSNIVVFNSDWISLKQITTSP